ncbi:MAG: gliding motility-associated C-terminal domain-containing protein [Ferruginibacter sp.]
MHRGLQLIPWTPTAGLSNPNIVNPVATTSTTTTYTVNGTNALGCVAQASVLITILPKPIILKSKDTAICNTTSAQLFASGGTTYSWMPAATLDNPNIATPVATPTAPITKYYVTVTNNAANTCTNSDSIVVSIKPAPVFSISPPQETCAGKNVQLTSSGGNIYLWSPASLVSNAAIANPMTSANNTTNYSVTITESICNISTTLSTLVTVNPALNVDAFKSNDIDCSIGFANLTAFGASQYTWTPSTGLSNNFIASPVATPTVTTLYTVNAKDPLGCTASDTVTVVVSTSGNSTYSMPNSFTPNGDGINDCFGIKYWGQIQDLQFFIFNRYGEKVFSTTDPNKCWDGKYKTDRPENGTYVYYIKAKTACGTVERKGNVILLR